jgi:hypothetical protein
LGIVREDGWMGLWRGLGPALILTSNPAITFGMFERVKRSWLGWKRRRGEIEQLTAMEVFYLGLLCKTLATVVTYPYIMAKVRMQWRPADYDQNEQVRYKSAMDVLIKVLKSDGVGGVYKGLSAQISKAVLTQALLFVIKDQIVLATYVLLQAINVKD